MEFNKKIETFKMFDLTFEIRKDKRTKYRIIFCQDKLIVGVENYLAYYKISKNWKKDEIVKAFTERCEQYNIGKKEILEYINK